MAYRNEDKRKQIKIELSTRVRGGSGRQLGSGALAYFRLYLLAVESIVYGLATSPASIHIHSWLVVRV